MDIVVYLVIAVFVVALAVLGYFVYDLRKKLKSLFPNSDKQTESLNKIFDNYIKKLEKTSKDIEGVNQRMDELESESRSFLQIVNFRRFNPFKETGGDQSFLLALMDDKKNGILITSLHSREGTRVYAKELKAGKSLSNLSDEEKAFLNIK